MRDRSLATLTGRWDVLPAQSTAIGVITRSDLRSSAPHFSPVLRPSVGTGVHTGLSRDAFTVLNSCLFSPFTCCQFLSELRSIYVAH